MGNAVHIECLSVLISGIIPVGLVSAALCACLHALRYGRSAYDFVWMRNLGKRREILVVALLGIFILLAPFLVIRRFSFHPRQCIVDLVL